MRKFDFNSFILFHSIVISFGDNYKIIKYAGVIYLCIFIFLKASKKIFAPFKKLNIAIMVFVLTVLLSGIHGQLYFSRYSWHVNYLSSILLALQIFVLFFYIEYVISTNKMIKALNSILGLLIIYISIADAYIITHLSSIIDDSSQFFLVGNKFQVSYLHLMLLAFYFSKFQKKNIVLIFLLFLSVFISYSVYCSTGVIGSVLICVLILLQNRIGFLLYSPYFICIAMIASGFFVVFVDLILAYSWFQQILELLGENSTLTGRTAIYAQVFDLVYQSPWFGYGNGNGSTLVDDYVGFGNTQNGIIENIINWGICGVTSLFILIITLLESVQRSHKNWAVLSLLYVFIAMSLVEITMGINFIFIMSIYLLVSNMPSATNERKTTVRQLIIKK